MATKRKAESELYEPVKEFLHSRFSAKFGNCHLELTASGRFGETLKKAVRHETLRHWLRMTQHYSISILIPNLNEWLPSTNHENMLGWIPFVVGPSAPFKKGLQIRSW